MPRSANTRTRGAVALIGVLAAAGALWAWWPDEAEPAAAAPAPRPSAAPVEEAAPLPTAISRAMLGADAGAATSTAVTVLLYGFVRDTDGQPVAAATIRALPHRRGEALVAKSGAEGEYLIAGAPPVLDTIEVSATGYVPSTTTSPSLPGVASRRARYDVVLRPIPGIRGLVRCDGEPVPGAHVYAEPVLAEGPRRRHRAIAAAKSGPDGRFALELDPVPGQLRVRAWSGTCGDGEALTEGAPVTIELEGGARVSGRVIDGRTRRPVPSFWVSASSLLRDAGGPPAVAVDDERGAFELGPLAPGPQRLYVAATGYQPASKDVELTAGGRVSDVVVELTRSTELRGRVLDVRTRRPIEGAQVAPADWNAEVLSDAVGTTTGPDGRYVLSVLPGKTTSVVASARGYRTLMHGGVNGRSERALDLDLWLTPADRDGGASNELMGIGAQLSMTERGVEVMGLVAGGPAASKLRRGDVIVKVDDTPVGSMELNDVVQAIRGEQGTEVVLWIQRGPGEPQRIVFERARVSWSR